MHLLTGIGSYITAPLWLLFLLSGVAIALQARFIPPDYFPFPGKELFPRWPVIDPVRAMWVFIGTMGLLLVPKLLGMVTVLCRRDLRRGCGGLLGLVTSLLLETVIAGLLAPVVMLTQSIDVVAILLGRDSGWNAQRRDDGRIPLRDIVRLYRRHTIRPRLPAGVPWAWDCAASVCCESPKKAVLPKYSCARPRCTRGHSPDLSATVCWPCWVARHS
jgi:membrane glycosyltransferase